jgi:hypothetical protein
MSVIFKDISAVFIDGVGKDTEAIQKLINAISKKIEFKSILHFSVNPIENIKNVTGFKINKMNYGEYNNFCLKNVYPFIQTEFTIWMQPDGFILNPNLWNDDFYNYDYIGAPWPWFRYFVGNGGFSFRSKKLLHAATKLGYTERNEDAVICDLERSYFLSFGCKYGTAEIGSKWALETEMPNFDNDLNNKFGFHGRELLDRAKIIFNKNFEVINENI